MKRSDWKMSAWFGMKSQLFNWMEAVKKKDTSDKKGYGGENQEKKKIIKSKSQKILKIRVLVKKLQISQIYQFNSEQTIVQYTDA